MLRYEKLYNAFMKIIDNDTESTYLKFKSEGFMDLVIEKLYDTKIKGLKATVYSMTHYGKQNGDLMADPDMEVAVYHQAGSIEALTYQNDYAGVFSRVYNDDYTKMDTRTKTDLNEFLSMWLKNIKEQDYERFKEAN